MKSEQRRQMRGARDCIFGLCKGYWLVSFPSILWWMNLVVMLVRKRLICRRIPVSRTRCLVDGFNALCPRRVLRLRCSGSSDQAHNRNAINVRRPRRVRFVYLFQLLATEKDSFALTFSDLLSHLFPLLSLKHSFWSWSDQTLDHKHDILAMRTLRSLLAHDPQATRPCATTAPSTKPFGPSLFPSFDEDSDRVLLYTMQRRSSFTSDTESSWIRLRLLALSERDHWSSSGATGRVDGLSITDSKARRPISASVILRIP